MHYIPSKIEKEPTLSLDEILNFIYSLNGFEINSSKKTQYFCLGEWFVFNSEYDLDLFNIYLRLFLESAIDLNIRELGNDNNIINKKLKEELEKYIVEDYRDKFTKKLFKLDKEYDLLSIFYNWESISKLIRKYDGFDISISINGYNLLNLLFRKITEYKGYENIKKNKIINELYENISKKINGEINYSKQIEIFYTFDNYIENYILVFPLLKELENNGNLKISKIKIEKDYIYFYLEKFIDFKKEVILKLLERIIEKEIIKVEYKNDLFYINNDNIPFDNNNTKIFHLYRFIFDAYKKYNKNHITYIECEKFFDENSENYTKIKRDFFKNYDSKIRKDLQMKNKAISDKFGIEAFIGIDKSGIWCEYYTPEKS